ncbi:MAG: phage Gp37/Gp68 family protein [Proteobacteria bacterium]|nr:phage Gp37/Gp68 family protein [Pseudomonadota bacterium]
MAENSKIEWTDATWNPIGGCTRVDEGCRNCYAEIMAARFSGPGQWGEGLAQIVGQPGKTDHRWTGKLRFNESALDKPLRWRKPRRIFVNSTSDLFHEAVPDEWIDRVFAVMALAPQHTFQVLTKRPERARDYMSHLQSPIYWADLAVASRKGGVALVGDMGFLRNHPVGPLRNVWLGTSISDQASTDLRIPHLLACPAAVRFISAEPLLGPVDLTRWIGTQPYIPGASTHEDQDGHERQDIGGAILDGLDLVIVGGESGPGARPMHPDWARSLRDQCQAAGVAFHFKQWGEWAPSTPEDAAGNPRSGWRCFAGHPHVPRAAELYPEAGAAFIARVGKKAAGRLLDGRTWDQMPGVAG